MMHRTAPNNRELSDPNIIMPGLRNSANFEINNRVLGHMEFTVLQGKLTGKQGNCVDATGEVIGVPIISPLEVVQQRVHSWLYKKILFWKGVVVIGNRGKDVE